MRTLPEEVYKPLQPPENDASGAPPLVTPRAHAALGVLLPVRLVALLPLVPTLLLVVALPLLVKPFQRFTVPLVPFLPDVVPLQALAGALLDRTRLSQDKGGQLQDLTQIVALRVGHDAQYTLLGPPVGRRRDLVLRLPTRALVVLLLAALPPTRPIVEAAVTPPSERAPV